MDKRFYLDGGEILDNGYLLSGKKQYVDVMNQLNDAISKEELRHNQEKLELLNQTKERIKIGLNKLYGKPGILYGDAVEEVIEKVFDYFSKTIA